MVRGGGLEPPHPCGRQDLNLVRLPISPPAHRKLKTMQLDWLQACPQNWLAFYFNLIKLILSAGHVQLKT